MADYSPKDFLKSRRPYKFSDSTVVAVSKLNRSLLEYHLATLTSRSQENDFENFARKLCQVEICPNLRPLTGPVGGGDGKVDSESIPVSVQTRLSYYLGIDNQTSDRLAFAFSAKEAWTGKCKSDVKKIYETDRDYKRIYFVTNQFARAQTRAKIEDDLTKQYGSQIIVLDRTWILDKVLGNKREKIAIEELKMGAELEERKVIGPLDFQRKREFEKLNTSIEESNVNNNITFTTVNDCVQAAILARELEEPRTDVEGLFDRAIRLANLFGTKDQLFTAIYERVWTTFFWFEDFTLFLKLYDEVETLAIKSKNIFTVERLNNIWQLLLSLSRTTNTASKDFLKTKTESLKNKLNSFKNDETAPSSALQAEVMLCFMDLAQHKDDNNLVSETFESLQTLLVKANTMIGFPFESFFEILTDMDSVFGGDVNYENLQETLIDLETKRRGEIPAAELLLKRGIQHLNSERIYKAIDSFGRTLSRFYKLESKDQLVKSLYLLSFAYEEAGLLWAARGALLNAAAYATSDLWTYSRINAMQLSCFERLAMIELRLARVGYALEWYELFSFLSSQIIKSREEEDRFIEKFDHFDSILGLLLIKTPDYDLPSLEKLPDTLLSMRLDYSAWGLLYRLGGKELLPESFLTKQSGNEIAQFFNLWLTQPAQSSLPSIPNFYLTDTVELKSRILGCDYTIKTVNSSPEIELAEYIIAALESLLSTAIELSAIATDSDALVTISKDNPSPNGIQYTKKDDGRIHIAVTCKDFNPHILSKSQQEEIYTIVSEIVLFITGHSVMFKEANKDLKKLFKEEEVSSRAFNFSSPLVALGNVLGSNPKRSISQWIKEDAGVYSFAPEKSGKPVKNEEFKSTSTSKKLETSLLRHDEIKNISIIRQHLWEAAGWEGVTYFFPSTRPPILAFLFKNEAKAKAIFEEWKERFGEIDHDEIIRITMVRGLYKKNPTWYRALVTSNFDAGKLNNQETFMATRIHTLTPETTINLDRFVESFNKYGIYLFAPAIYDKTKNYPNIFITWGIVKREFIEKDAWEIDLDDIDKTAITSDADPIIPSGVKDAPVLKVLQQRKKKK